MSKNGGNVIGGDERAEDDVPYLETLEEAVLYENQVVTYKWLCQKLGTTANVAKQMLFAFAETQRKRGTNLEVMYLVAGMKKGSTSTKPDDYLVHSVCIVPGSRLEDVKLTFLFVTSLHVYSVHKSVITDSDVLYSVDHDLAAKFDIKRASSIVCSEAKPRAITTSTVIIGQKNEQLSMKPTIQKPTDANGSGDKGTKDEIVTAKAAVSISKPQKNKVCSLSSMFAAMTTKKQVSAIKGDPPSTKAERRETENKVQIEAEISNSSDGLTLMRKAAVKDTEDKNKSKKIPDKRKKSKAKLDPPKKRRRRIVEVSESSSDEDACNPCLAEEESEDPRPRIEVVSESDLEIGEEKEDPLPSQTDDSSLNITAKTRRLVEETVEDDDGYLKTQKKWVECSDEEISKETTVTVEVSRTTKIMNISNPSPKKAAKVTPPSAKSKQATLTTFFKRK